MISFILWVVFILAVLLSVPIAAAMEKRGRTPSDMPAVGDDSMESAEVAEMDEAGGVMAVDPEDPFGGAVEVQPGEDPFA